MSLLLMVRGVTQGHQLGDGVIDRVRTRLLPVVLENQHIAHPCVSFKINNTRDVGTDDVCDLLQLQLVQTTVVTRRQTRTSEVHYCHWRWFAHCWVRALPPFARERGRLVCGIPGADRWDFYRHRYRVRGCPSRKVKASLTLDMRLRPARGQFSCGRQRS